MQKERFKRPEPGFSMYEGRTRGKRIKYTYSDDEDFTFSDSTNRRSARNTGANTPAETGPVTTSSGRQIRAPPRLNVATGDSAPNSVQGDTPDFDTEGSVGPTGRPRRSAAMNRGTNGWTGSESRSRRNTSVGSDEEVSEAELGDDEDDADEHIPEESEAEDDDSEEDAPMLDDDLDDQPSSLVVKLSVTPPKLKTALDPLEQEKNGLAAQGTPMQDAPMQDAPMQGAPLQEAPAAASVETQQPPAVEKPKEESAPVRPKTPEATGPAAPLAEKETNIGPAPATSLAFRGSPEKPQEAQERTLGPSEEFHDRE